MSLWLSATPRNRESAGLRAGGSFFGTDQICVSRRADIPPDAFLSVPEGRLLAECFHSVATLSVESICAVSICTAELVLARSVLKLSVVLGPLSPPRQSVTLASLVA